MEIMNIDTVDIAATKEAISLLNRNAWLRKKAKDHPDDVPVSGELLAMVMTGTYKLSTPRAQQLLRYLEEDGYLRRKEAAAA